MKARDKELRQGKEHDFDFEGEIVSQILENERHYYDTTAAVDLIEAEFNENEKTHSREMQKFQELCFL
jgi:hypothetical protein